MQRRLDRIKGTNKIANRRIENEVFMVALCFLISTSRGQTDATQEDTADTATESSVGDRLERILEVRWQTCQSALVLASASARIVIAATAPVRLWCAKSKVS